MESPMTLSIPHSTQDNPHGTQLIPHGTEQPHGTHDVPTFIMNPQWDSRYPPTCIMIFSHGTEHPPQYCTHVMQGGWSEVGFFKKSL